MCIIKQYLFAMFAETSSKSNNLRFCQVSVTFEDIYENIFYSGTLCFMTFSSCSKMTELESGQLRYGITDIPPIATLLFFSFQVKITKQFYTCKRFSLHLASHRLRQWYRFESSHCHEFIMCE